MTKEKRAFIKNFRGNIAFKIKNMEDDQFLIDDKTALALYFIFIYENNLWNDFQDYKKTLLN